MASKKNALNNTVIAAWALIVLGVLFMTQNLVGIDLGRMWPVILIVVGFGILVNQGKD